MKLPKDFMDEYLAKAIGATMYDIPIVALTRDELIACIGYFSEKEQRRRDLANSDRDFLNASR